MTRRGQNSDPTVAIALMVAVLWGMVIGVPIGIWLDGAVF